MELDLPAGYIDHFMHPRGVGLPISEFKTIQVHSDKSGCFDQLDLFFVIEDDILKDIRFRGRLCSGSIAAASTICELCVGFSVAKGKAISREDIIAVWGGVPAGKEHSINLVLSALSQL